MCTIIYWIFGLPADGKRRWCAGCAKAHAEAEDVTSKNIYLYNVPNFLVHIESFYETRRLRLEFLGLATRGADLGGPQAPPIW